MHAVIVGEVPGFDEWLAQRRTLGHDSRDEVWDGVLHVVPPTSFRHQEFELDLVSALRPIAAHLGLIAIHEVGVFLDSGFERENYRRPDIVVVDPTYVSKRGVERRAELVVEVLSPDDESRQKLGFYARCGIPEYWIVEPYTRAIEVYVLRDGAYQLQPARADAAIEAPRLGLVLRVVDGPKLRVAWADGAAEL